MRVLFPAWGRGLAVPRWQPSLVGVRAVGLEQLNGCFVCEPPWSLGWGGAAREVRQHVGIPQHPSIAPPPPGAQHPGGFHWDPGGALQPCPPWRATALAR